MNNKKINYWLIFAEKRGLGVLANLGLSSAFIFDASKSLLLVAWTAPLPYTYLSNAFSITVATRVALLSFIECSRVIQFFAPAVRTIAFDILGKYLTPPFCVSDMRYLLFQKFFRHFPQKLIRTYLKIGFSDEIS